MKDVTHIAVLLDRSGSMESIKDETISGFNYFLKEQKENGANAYLTLVQFDTQSTDVVEENTPIVSVQSLNPQTYQPRGGTPLLDALGDTINSTGNTLKNIPESGRPDKIVFVIITDGEENSSHRYSRVKIKEMIEHQSDVYDWQFVYLGANQDAFAEAGGMGIAADNTANYLRVNTAAAFAAASTNVASYRSTGDSASLKYSGKQRTRLTKQQPE